MGAGDWEDSSDSRGDNDLRVVRLCYKCALLRSRPAAQLSSEELDEMRTLEKLLLGDPMRSRRTFRRITTVIPARVRAGDQERPGLLLNLSPAGMFIAISSPLPRGTAVEVELRSPDGDSYIFTGVVLREELESDHPGVGLSLTQAPFVTRDFDNQDTSSSA